MTERPPGSDVESDAEALHHALINLHDLAGVFGDVDLESDKRFRPSSPAESLRMLAGSDSEAVPHSARLGVLHDLARAGLPRFDSYETEYRQLVETVAASHRISAEDLFADISRSAAEGVPFSTTDTGRSLPHHVAAFVGEDICHTRTVTVGGLGATWIFSEFETDAPFDHVAEWIDPRSWPERGPLLFKGMDIVEGGDPIPIDPAIGSDHWHAVFHEKVQIIATLNTWLHCDYWHDGQRASGMTYGLALSLDNAIDVDQGFLSVTDVGPVRRVKALKIVGFTQDRWDRVARTVCPVWTDWVRSAVEGGSHSTPLPVPTGGTFPGREAFDAWLEFFGDSARTYFDLFADTSTRLAFGEYTSSDWVADSTRYWSQIAQDWARAWAYGRDLLEDVAERGLSADFAPPDRREAAPETRSATGMAAAAAPAGRSAEGTLIPLPGLETGTVPVCTDLTSIEAGAVRIRANEVSVSVEDIDEQTRGARVRTTNTSVPAGLYVGELHTPDGRRLVPVQLYVSRAGGAGTV